MMSNLVCVRTPHKKPTKAEQRARALEQCRHGHHSMRKTLTPGEQLCMTCGFMTYCPSCVPAYGEHKPMTRAHALLCITHRTEGEQR